MVPNPSLVGQLVEPIDITRAHLEKIIIGAPFGNYLNFEGATSTLGTFTWEYRGGFWKRVYKVLKTVRYYPGIQAWKNQLGLPNPGIRSLKKNANYKIISITGFNEQTWTDCLIRAFSLHPLMIEMNISCPNCKISLSETDYLRVFHDFRCIALKDQIIFKLPPIGYMDIVKEAIYLGIFNFHCCNTLPTPGGGLSGKPLKALSLKAVEEVRKLTDSQGYKFNYVIGGGGVTCLQDVIDYVSAGATNVSIASALFFPWKWLTVRKIIKVVNEPL